MYKKDKTKLKQFHGLLGMIEWNLNKGDSRSLHDGNDLATRNYGKNNVKADGIETTNSNIQLAKGTS